MNYLIKRFDKKIKFDLKRKYKIYLNQINFILN